MASGDGQKTIERLRNDFAYHKPTSTFEQERIKSVRQQFFALASFVAEAVPPGRDQAMALSHLEEGMRAANAGIAKQWPVSEPL